MNPIYYSMSVAELSRAVKQGDRDAAMELAARVAGTVNAVGHRHSNSKEVLVRVPNKSGARLDSNPQYLAEIDEHV